jgi:hypothetical protein
MVSAEAERLNATFVANMRPLWRKYPQLAMAVDAVDDDERLSLEPTRSGAWTAKAQGAYLHSRYDPEAEAANFAKETPIEEAFCLIVGGIGLGYHLRPLLARLRGDAFILCLEPSLRLIATALTCVDFSQAILANKLVIVTQADNAYLHDLLKPFGPLITLGAQAVTHTPSVRLAEAEYIAILNAVAAFAEHSRIGMSTLMFNARVTCHNLAMNLAACASTPPIDVIRGRFPDNPAIVVSAGPSLGRNIDQLAGLKGKAILIAVQTTLQPLMRRGIVPDFVTSLDYHEISRKYFEGVDGLENVHLVAEPKAAWHVMDGYPGPMSLLDNDWLRMLTDKLGPRGAIEPGNTVSHLAFYLAAYMGCNPIIFVGQDLAFTGYVEHVPGVEIHRTWYSETNRFCSMEAKEWERIVRSRPILRRVPATIGGELYTNVLLATYRERFEAAIAGIPNRVINCTEGGAHIQGTEVLTLSEASERHCSELIDQNRFAYREMVRWRNPAMLERVRADVEKRIEELGALEVVCDELLAILAELEGLTGDPVRFNQLLAHVDELRVLLRGMYGTQPGYPRAISVVGGANQVIEFMRYYADKRIHAAKLSGVELAKAQLKRDANFVIGLRDGTREMVDMLGGSLPRFAEVA